MSDPRGLYLERKAGDESKGIIYIKNGEEVIKISLLKSTGKDSVGLRVMAPPEYKILRAEILSLEELNQLERMLQNGN